MPFGIQGRKPLIKSLFGLCLMATLFFITDLQQLALAALSADPRYLAAGLGLFFVQGIFESFRLSLVFSSYDVNPPRAFRLFLVGLFFSNFMPGMIGADVYQVHQMNAIRPGLLQPVSLSLYLRASGLAVNLAMALVALTFSSNAWFDRIPFSLNELSVAVWTAYGMFAFSIVVLLSMLANRGRAILKRFLSKSASILSGVVVSARSFSFSQHLTVVLLGIAVVLVRVLGLIMLTYAFASPISFPNALIAVTITTCALVLPISIAGLGLRELSVIAFLVAFGVSPAPAVGISLTGRLFIWALSAVGGIWFVIDHADRQSSKDSGQEIGSAK